MSLLFKILDNQHVWSFSAYFGSCILLFLIMNNISRSARSNTSQQLSSLKNNLEELARQLETQRLKTNIKDDEKFWMMENKHLSKLLKERDNTIRSLKKISKQRNTNIVSPFKKDISHDHPVEQYKSKIHALQKEIGRLNKSMIQLTEKCELLQQTIKSQHKQIQLFQKQNQQKKTKAQINVIQSKLKYEQMSQKIKNKLNWTSGKSTKYTNSSDKDALVLSMQPLQFLENQKVEKKYFDQSKEDMNPQDKNRSSRVWLRESSQIPVLQKQIVSLKKQLNYMKMHYTGGVRRTDSFYNNEGEQLGLSSCQRQKYQQKLRNKANLAILLQKRINQLQNKQDQ